MSVYYCVYKNAHVLYICFIHLGNIWLLRMAFTVYQRIPIFNMLNDNAFISITLETLVVKINITEYKFIFQATLLDFGWRSAFKKVSLPMAHSITTATEDFLQKFSNRNRMKGFQL